MSAPSLLRFIKRRLKKMEDEKWTITKKILNEAWDEVDPKNFKLKPKSRHIYKKIIQAIYQDYQKQLIQADEKITKEAADCICAEMAQLDIHKDRVTIRNAEREVASHVQVFLVQHHNFFTSMTIKTFTKEIHHIANIHSDVERGRKTRALIQLDKKLRILHQKMSAELEEQSKFLYSRLKEVILTVLVSWSERKIRQAIDRLPSAIAEMATRMTSYVTSEIEAYGGTLWSQDMKNYLDHTVDHCTLRLQFEYFQTVNEANRHVLDHLSGLKECLRQAGINHLKISEVTAIFQDLNLRIKNKLDSFHADALDIIHDAFSVQTELEGRELPYKIAKVFARLRDPFLPTTARHQLQAKLKTLRLNV